MFSAWWYGLLCHQSEGREVERAQSASVESIPEVLEDRDVLADQSDSASVHDMDYVNPRGVRFTQSSQKEGKRNSVSKIHVKGLATKFTSQPIGTIVFLQVLL